MDVEHGRVGLLDMAPKTVSVEEWRDQAILYEPLATS